MSHRALLIIAASCALLFALGGVLLIGQARLRAEASVVHLTARDGVNVAPETLLILNHKLSQTQLWQSMRVGAILAKQNPTVVASGVVSTNSNQYLNLRFLMVESRFGWFPSLATLPIGAGLALLMGTLFTAAAKWRPRVKAAP